jgi:paraquat-inducible protein B
LNRVTTDNSHHSHVKPKAIVKKMRWPYPLVWLVPIGALLIAGYFVAGSLAKRGPEITIKFANADGLSVGQTKVMHLGVQIGDLTAIVMGPDQNEVLVKVRLYPSEKVYAQSGAQFWVVRPEISAESISGLGTVLSGPYIDTKPGSGDMEKEFTALEKAPVLTPDGLQIVLKAARASHLASGTPIYFRDVEVGVVQDVKLSSDGAGVDVMAVIRKPYAVLVKSNSQFWVVAGVDVKGGLFTGISMKMDSLRSLLSGGVAFATPEKDMGEQAKNGSEYVLHDDVQKEWLNWSPKISVTPDEKGTGKNSTGMPGAPDAIRSSVGQ